MMSFEEFLTQPHTCNECCEEIPHGEAAVIDITDHGTEFALCNECMEEAS